MSATPDKPRRDQQHLDQPYADRPRPDQPHLALPLVGQPPPERADAARNRRKILDAAARLVAERGADAVTMNAVAHASGIGVGTVYRRFGTVAQLLIALLNDREMRLQEAFLSGPPPLGPDAPPAERLRAFLHALADHIDEQHAVSLAAEAADPGARFRGGPYATVHTHVAMLVGQARPEADAPVLAHLLLAPMAPSLLHHLRAERGYPARRIKGAIDQLLTLDLNFD
ncbi:helix-turn-helix domain-containing protein [Streptomyces sp. LHD-70]|uniref:TetR/AcrR family transcriptional regulator n=1 Tax=Streptomyces sp. LHD-70 TaxID=3072140 RepID=UPI00280E25C1|nr:helix-turn-helix domain-containing protein [Streptomyces sp. LHD-70]MDQ8705930.1 helix-turn-helix domain-containing protein [Streptomyces sp. LHD-70]